MSYRDKQFKTCIVSVDEIGIATIQINRPKAFNSVNVKLLDETFEILEGCHYDPEVKVIIICGNENAFAAGADLKTIKDYNAFEARDFLDKAHKTIYAVEDNHKPTIAAVNGLALGGGLELVMACDIRIVADNATLGLPEINLGIFPGAGGTQRFPRNASICKAKQYIFTGDFFDAATAEKMGLINMVVSAAEVLDTAKKFAKKLTRKSPLALREAKNAINLSMDTDIKSGCRAEQLGWSMLFSSEDQKEGFYAFLKNRKAEFKGK
ncbi:Enoyl-CoA hydratase [Candidatus Syntrophocurvum alkaliphilum]|uniref:short-chain-enoyl-CoA hydratase n=1 Tax=Candidatus Syntrophocurvum alkaliphilum TaxID=2293317 RepID=A0A6I6DC53_9FIRM|nr:enoyl-CoA hydratase-related protein [Candidatus Syntrophocurvum alkaliphilum]QGU00186.1 Enoyl-CoA hydratase [Candidatus Syntrophocurvum alkaliphilum]